MTGWADDRVGGEWAAIDMAAALAGGEGLPGLGPRGVSPRGFVIDGCNRGAIILSMRFCLTDAFSIFSLKG